MNDKSTDEMDIEIQQADDLKKYLEENNGAFREEAFANYLNEMVALKQLEKKELNQKADISSTYFYELTSHSNKKAPSRDVVLKLAIGLTLTLEQTNRLLKLAGLGELYSKKKRDSIIIYCLNHSKDLIYTDGVLQDENLPTLSNP